MFGYKFFFGGVFKCGPIGFIWLVFGGWKFGMCDQLSG